mgnify:CR=1 FL=1
MGFLNKEALFSLWRVKSNSEYSPKKGMNCLGLSLVDKGQSLFPDPPAKTIGLNFLLFTYKT